MSQDLGFGHLRVFAGRSRQANDAFQALKRHFDPPTGAIKIAGLDAGEGSGIEQVMRITHSAAASVPAAMMLPSHWAARRALAREISAASTGLRKATRRNAKGGAFLRRSRWDGRERPRFPRL